MKKSEIYKVAQISVLESNNITTRMKLEALKELIELETTALWVEKQEKTDEAV